MNGLSPWLDLTPTRRAPDEGVVMGTVVAIHDQATGLVEVHVDGAPAGQTVITPSAAGLTYIGARVRVSRDTSGAAVMAHAPTGRAPAGTKTVAVGETGRALQDLTGRVNDLADTSDADVPVLGWDSGIRGTGSHCSTAARSQRAPGSASPARRKPTRCPSWSRACTRSPGACMRGQRRGTHR